MQPTNEQFYELLKTELDTASHESILDMMRQNLALLHDLESHASLNASGVDAVMDQTETIKTQIASNAHTISTDRTVLVDFNQAIAENRAEVAAKLLLRGRASRIHSSLDEVFDGGELGSVSTRGSGTKPQRRVPRVKQPTGGLQKPVRPTWKPNMTAAQLQQLQQQAAAGSDARAAAHGGIASLHHATWCPPAPKPAARLAESPVTPQRQAALPVRGASPLNTSGSSGPETGSPTKDAHA